MHFVKKLTKLVIITNFFLVKLLVEILKVLAPVTVEYLLAHWRFGISHCIELILTYFLVQCSVEKHVHRTERFKTTVSAAV